MLGMDQLQQGWRWEGRTAAKDNFVFKNAVLYRGIYKMNLLFEALLGYDV